MPDVGKSLSETIDEEEDESQVTSLTTDLIASSS